MTEKRRCSIAPVAKRKTRQRQEWIPRDRHQSILYRFVCTFESKALGGPPVLLRTYQSGSAPIQCTIWEAARATSAAPTFFPPVTLRNYHGSQFVDAGVGCNNPTRIIVKEAKAYYRTKGYKATRPTCVVSIGTDQNDLIQLHDAASMFWFKDRSGLSIAPVLGNIVTDCENTHNEMTLSCLDDKAADTYYRFNVPQGMQQIVLDEWDKAMDIRTYTSYYLRLNQTEHDVRECIKLLRQKDEEDVKEQGPKTRSDPRILRITPGGNDFGGHYDVRGGVQFQGNFVDLQHVLPPS